MLTAQERWAMAPRVQFLHRILLLLFCGMFLTEPNCYSATYTAPPAWLGVDANNGAGDIVHTVHIQTVYARSLFTNTGPMLIQEIRYRPSATYGVAFTSTIPNLQLNLSTTGANPEGLSTTFANNRGANDTVVFQGPITLSSRFVGSAGGPKAFDIVFPLRNAFLYDPTAGNLLIELRNFSNNQSSHLDVAGTAGDGAGRMFSVDPNATTGAADTGSDIVQLVYTVPSSAPVITSHPQSQSVPVDSTVTLTVGAYGSQPLSYQWSFNETNLANATNSSLVLNTISFANEGTYRVVVTNAFGRATSSNAVLDVYTVPPTITSQPPTQRVPLGASATFTVVVAGTQPLAYQWTFNGNALSHATNSSLVLDNLTLVDGGEYRVTVTNLYGQVTSAPAYLDVYETVAAPSVTETPGPSSRRTPLAISEIMYHPAARTDLRNLEFIEIHNTAAISQKLDGFRLSGSIDFVFPANTTLAPNARLVVAANRADLQAVYDIATVVGNFTNNLPNDSGTVRLRNRQDAVLLEINYSDMPPWPVAPDGGGHSLVLARPSIGEGHPLAWRASVLMGGSPGTVEPAIFDPRNNVIINEILTHNDDPQQNFIELKNHGRTSVDLSGCILTDDPATNRFRIADADTLAVGAFAYFTQAQLRFPLDPTGGRIFLVNSNRTRVIDAIRYGAQAANVSYGRAPDGSTLWSELTTRTPGTTNTPVLGREIVINEIMYRPISGSSDDEFVEIYNRGTSAVNLGGWQFVDGISFTFPSNTVLSAGSYLAVAKNVSRLRANYPTLSLANSIGDYDGSLAGPGERLALAMPQTTYSTNPSNGAFTRTISYVIIDEVAYNSGGRWGKWAQGGGASLELIDPNSDNRLASNWADSAAPTNASWTTIEYSGPHEFWDGNSPLTGFEISLLGEGECFVDDVEVRSAGGANQLSNPSFSSGSSGWIFEGNHELSTVTNNGGIGNTPCLHLRAAGRGDYLGSRVWTQWGTSLNLGTPGTLRAKVRWSRGWPEILLRLRGGTLEATGPLTIPSDLGTPGRANSRWAGNRGPAVFDVTHTPILPGANEAIVVSARASDPNGITNIAVVYRLDPSDTFNSVPLRDDGTGGDALARDGHYAAIIPGQPAGRLIAFQIRATDSNGLTTVFPNDAPTRECLVRFGETQTAGSFGTYRMWMTAATVSNWTYRSSARINGRPLDFTFVYNNQRVIYNAGGAFNGSDNTSELYDTPLNYLCGYTLVFPDDDQFLGATEAVLDWPTRDRTGQHEQMCYWMANEVGLPFNYRRFVHLKVNGIGESQRPSQLGDPPLIYEDVQTPGSDYLHQWYPDKSNGDLFKVQVWRRDYKFPARPSPNGEPYHASLERKVNLAGQHHTARYRWTWRKRTVNGSANDYSSFFGLVDAANIADPTNFVETLGALADVEQWMRIFAFERCVGNFDSYGNRSGHNMYLFKPEDGRWDLHTFDTDLVLGSTSEGTSDNLFGIYSPPGVTGVGVPEPVVTRMRNTPAFQRAYWRGFKEFVTGPMLSANYLPFANAQHAALLADGAPAASPNEFTGWIDARRNYIQSQLATVNTTFSVSFASGIFSTNRNSLTLSGTAPIDVKTIRVNGIERLARWTGVTTWSLSLALASGTNSLVIEGLDRLGHPVPGASATIAVNMTANNELPEESVVINEIMYNPIAVNGEFIELFNRSTTTAFDLSDWRIDGLDLNFKDGTVLGPRAYLVAVKSRIGFGRAYGFNIAVAGEYNGRFATNGETLRLVRAVGTNEVIVDSLAYENVLPWPPQANGLGSSLQLIDVGQDNNRIANWAAAPPTPGSANTVASALPTLPLLWLNEIQPNNVSGPVDNAGEHEPWVEIYNVSRTNYNLSGFYLTDNFTNLTRWAIPDGETIGAGALRVVWLDGQPGQTTAGELHATFRINSDSGSLALVSTLNNRTNVVDYLNFRSAPPDQSFGLFPDGESISRRWFFYPTAGKSNNPDTPPPRIWINEWMASNTRALFDETYGAYSDWFELFNASGAEVDLSGWRLSDSAQFSSAFIIPAGTTIPDRKFLLIWADNNPGLANGLLHVDFRLDRDGDDIALFDPRGMLIDRVNFGRQSNDVSQGRWPNGSPGSFHFMPIPTPAASNVIPDPPEVALLAVAVDGSGNVTITWTATPGRVYRVQAKDELDGPWTDLAGDIVAGTEIASKDDPAVPGHLQRFYRVVADPNE
jgi:hypothetical protein